MSEQTRVSVTQDNIAEIIRSGERLLDVERRYQDVNVTKTASFFRERAEAWSAFFRARSNLGVVGLLSMVRELGHADAELRAAAIEALPLVCLIEEAGQPVALRMKAKAVGDKIQAAIAPRPQPQEPTNAP